MAYNIGCILFGLAAWIIPCVLLFRQGKNRQTGVFASLACALICLLLVILGLRQEAFTGDFAAIEDTIGALSFAAVTQAAVTLLLNGILLGRK